MKRDDFTLIPEAPGTRLTTHLVSVSGGKDITATLLTALELHGHGAVRAAFADTGNEHEATYDYVRYLEQATGVLIVWLRRDFTDMWWPRRDYVRDKWPEKGVPAHFVARALAVFDKGPTGNPFLDLCIIKGRFPSRMAQFCTQFLKTQPLTEHALAMIDSTGGPVMSWQGIRLDESDSRRKRFGGTGACVKSYEVLGGGLSIHRPILRWSAADVFEAHSAKGIAPNPLYLQGRTRVGCLCINSSKEEVRQWGLRDHAHIERLHEWEEVVSLVSKRANATFFASPGDNDTARERGGIWQVVQWAKTTRGGKQYDLLGSIDEGLTCSSAFGLCE
ncbi:phosphoadenosine phosphosulfate reductase domain-containing protein [Xylophilus ampelinus]|uniref:3'-phosphoadenosine 5'-phosphosulfate sulfotransferase (PAPS reductase)/FAD synthetase n=1 Tax=Xylophilus ampelinus TaxID=54067 RepID=A0A318T2I6_9BURK|nr:phosphoadenosine phosphosulfate reductase family protein [Xylophilus ampelinus]MCS4509153.1 phosphoadenosine phosphosulfate reductase family protein [Xylophilus ampelinus]PYE79821.1 3'-phosphoadenosine 5'-phosphosulfate sulfotransferase (PAPS reductase)/FAD synthetase [Xylophilus ampelinus]